MNDKRTRAALLMECNKLAEENKDLKRELSFVNTYMYVIESNIFKAVDEELKVLKQHISDYLARHKDGLEEWI